MSEIAAAFLAVAGVFFTVVADAQRRETVDSPADRHARAALILTAVACFWAAFRCLP